MKFPKLMEYSHHNNESANCHVLAQLCTLSCQTMYIHMHICVLSIDNKIAFQELDARNALGIISSSFIKC